MAAAMARGWRGAVDQMLFTDSGSGKAARLATELGGEALASNSELAERAEVLVLAVKPTALEQVADQLRAATTVISVLGATPLQRVAAALPHATVIRVMPNVASEVHQGVLCIAGPASPELRALLEILGQVVELPDAEFDAATALMGCAPAYLALTVEALVEAGTAAGLDGKLARELVIETAAGTAALLRLRNPREVREAVASPGGSTEAGLQALERAGTRGGFEAAVRASLERMRGS